MKDQLGRAGDLSPRLVTLHERPDLKSTLADFDQTWPAFYAGSATPHGSLDRLWPDYQALLLDDHGFALASVRCFPVKWDGNIETIPEGLERALLASAESAPHETDIVCAYSIVVRPERRGEGLSAHGVRAMADLCRQHGAHRLIAPVRPSWKSRYPLTPISNYINWRRPDGLPFDPWLRVHARLGAQIVRLAPRSMTCRGRVSDWERWARMPFPESGRYLVPEALEPVAIDVENDLGVYQEPNVWMLHQLA